MSRRSKAAAPGSIPADETPAPLEPKLLAGLELVASKIDEIMQAAPIGTRFKVNGPQLLPIKTRFGTFITKAFVGDEEFKPHGCYLGKSGRLIYTFTPLKVSDFMQVEIKHDKLEALAGFKAWLEEQQGIDEEKFVEEMREERAREQQEEKKRQERELANNPDFGSW